MRRSDGKGMWGNQSGSVGDGEAGRVMEKWNVVTNDDTLCEFREKYRLGVRPCATELSELFM